MLIILISAKNNINVNEIFTTLIDSMVKLDIESNGAFRRSRSKVGRILSTNTIEDKDMTKKKKKNCC